MPWQVGWQLCLTRAAVDQQSFAALKAAALEHIVPDREEVFRYSRSLDTIERRGWLTHGFRARRNIRERTTNKRGHDA